MNWQFYPQTNPKILSMQFFLPTLTRIAALLLAMLCHAASADVGAGIAAYKRGDYVGAFAELGEAAKKDDAAAMNLLGIMYVEGRGVGRNERVAADWFLKAETMGSLEATANLGRMYAEGLGVQQSNREALQHYRDAALRGYSPAMKRLAEIYERGELGVKPDPEFAQSLLARLGNTPTVAQPSSPAPTPAMPRNATPPQVRNLGKPIASKPLPAVTAVDPAKREVPASAQENSTAHFEKQVLQQLEKYQQRERKQQVASTDSSPAIAPYLRALRDKLRQRLAVALQSKTITAGMAVSLTIRRDGSLRSVELDHGSGDAGLDRKVLSSLKRLSRLPPLPADNPESPDVLVVTVVLPIE